MANRDALVLGNHNLAGFVGDVKACHFTAHTLGHELHLRATVHQTEVVEHKEVSEDGFLIQANGLEQDSDGHLAATVNAEIQDVFRVELEIQP